MDFQFRGFLFRDASTRRTASVPREDSSVSHGAVDECEQAREVGVGDF